MNSMADSSVDGRGGVRRSDSSWAWVRMLVSFFSLVGVDVHVARAAVLADDHALVDLDAGADEQLGALLEVEQAVGVRGARAVGHEHAVRPVRDLARPRPVALADLVEQRGPARVGQELAAIADQAAHRQDELHADAPVRVGGHLLEARLAAGQRRAGPRRCSRAGCRS